MKTTKTAAAFLAAAMLLLSACGNDGGKTENTSAANNGTTTTTTAAAAANKQGSEAAATTSEAEATTTAAPAEETTTTTEAPKAVEYPITVEIDNKINYVDGFENGETVLVDRKSNLWFVSENGETRTTELKFPAVLQFINRLADGLYSCVAGNGQILLIDADGNNVTNKFISDTNDSIVSCGTDSMLIKTYDDNVNYVFGLMDYNGNWIAKPDKENVFNKWCAEMDIGDPLYSQVLGDYVCSTWYGKDGLKIFDMKNNKIVATIDSYPTNSMNLFDSVLTEDSIIVPTKYDEKAKTTTFTKVDLSTGEQSTFELEGGVGVTNVLRIDKNSYVMYDDYQNKIGEIQTSGLYCADKNGYWLKEGKDFIYYTIEGEKRIIVKSK